eukprot:g6434.t1
MPENDPGPPTGPPPRILKLEYQGNVYNWFDLNQTEAARHDDFIDILRQNIVNYYQVPHEYQLLFDNDGLLIEPADVRRAVLYPEKPFLKLVDLRELVAEENGIGSGYGSGQVQALLRSDVEKMLNGYAADVEQLRTLLNRGSLLRHTAQLPAVPRIALHQDGVAGPDFPLPGIFGEARTPQTGFGSQVTSKDVLAVRRAFELAGTYRRLRKTEARLQKQLLVPPAGQLAIQPVTPSWPQWRGGAILASGITAAPRRTLSGAKEEDTVEQQENYLYNPNPIPTSSQQDQKASTLVVDPLAASAGLEGGGSGPATRGGTRPQRPATLRSPNVLRNSPLSTRYGGGGISGPGAGPLVLLETGGVDNADFFYPRIAAPGQQGGFLSGAKQRGLSPGAASVSSGGALSRSRQSKPIELPGSDVEVTTGNANEEGDQHAPGRVFTVTLTRNNDPTRKFGLVNVPYANDRLLVKFVDQYGLLHESNMKALRERTALRQIPDVVEVGDVILAVNDHKSVFGMRAELQNANTVNLLVQKTTTPSRSPSAEVLQRGASFLQTGGGSSRAAVLKSASKTSLSYVPGINMGGRGSGLSPGRGQQVEAEVTAASASTRSFVPGILKAREGRSLSPSRDWELQRSPEANANSDAALRARIRELEAALETRNRTKGAGTVSGLNYSTADRLLQTPNFAVGGGTAIPGGGATVLTGEQLYDLDGAAGAIFTGGDPDPSSAQGRAGAGAQPHTVFLQPGQEVTILKSPTATSPGEQLVLRAPGFEGARNLMDPFGRQNTISRTDQMNPGVAAAFMTGQTIGCFCGPAAAPIFVPADESADFVDDAADHEQIPSVPLAATNSYAAVAKKSVQEKIPEQNPDQEKRARSGSSPKRVSYRDNGVYTATDVADPVDLALEKECWKLEPGALGSERITRLKPMIYKLGDRKFFCNLVNSSLHVRVGGTTYVPFAEWALGLNRGADDSNSSLEMPNPYAGVG